MNQQMIKILGMLACMTCTLMLSAQHHISGLVLDRNGKPIEHVSLKVEQAQVRSDKEGKFSLQVLSLPIRMVVSHVNYRELTKLIENNEQITLVLEPAENAIEEVLVNTGYYTVPKERATGSFTVVGKEMLALSMDNNILNRLEGLANGVYFDKRNVVDEDFGTDPAIRIRGLSTIEGNRAPLIVLDNFPYYGDIASINPNDVESVTILRDAAAASIWGAQAGNGVIVITTKKARYNDFLQASVNSSWSWSQKPDLFYSQNYLPGSTMMVIQEELFNRKAYTENDRTKIPRYVELLIKKRDKLISDEDFEIEKQRFLNNDLRRDYLEHVYRVPLTQRYGLSFRKGSENLRMGTSLNVDKNTYTIIGNSGQRLTMNTDFGMQITKGLEWDANITYSYTRAVKNGNGFSTTNGMYSYESLMDAQGNPDHVSVKGFRYAYLEKATSLGLLDWLYRPLDEVDLTDDQTKRSEWRISQAIKYTLPFGLKLQANYQYQSAANKQEVLYDKNSFYVRNMVNAFTQSNGTRVIPYGNILDILKVNEEGQHAGRLQLNWNRNFSKDQWLTALAGAEIGQHMINMEPDRRLYNLDPQSWTYATTMNYSTVFYPTRPSGSQLIQSGNGYKDRVVNRQLSYFTNWAYGLLGRYTLSGSVRWDGSNLLGVKMNKKGTALWSTGIGWDMAKESFMGVQSIDVLKWRLTYGSAGNIDKSQSHYPTIRLSSNSVTGLQVATLMHPGNPSLGWEQVNTLNLALDWSLWNGKLSGTVDYYVKKAFNLLGSINIDPSTGVTANYKKNYADMQTKGLDFQLNSAIPILHELMWSTQTIVNLSRNKVTRYVGKNLYVDSYFTGDAAVEVGRSVDQVYAFPWYGLSPGNGMPLMRIDGQLTSEEALYTNYYQGMQQEDLDIAGQTVPKVFGSVWNGLKYKGWSLNALVSFRLGHVFRRNSIGPGQEYYVLSPTYHMDYFKRWKNLGDEQITDVPAWDDVNTPISRYELYKNSMALITPADVIKLDNIQLGYDFKYKAVRSMKVFAQCNQVGTLWKANKYGIDPDYINALYPAVRSFTAGVQLNF